MWISWRDKNPLVYSWAGKNRQLLTDVRDRKESEINPQDCHCSCVRWPQSLVREFIVQLKEPQEAEKALNCRFIKKNSF